MKSKLMLLILAVAVTFSVSAQHDDHHNDHKKCKGVKKSVVENMITFESYKHTLFKRQSLSVKQNGFRSYKHQIYTETVEKVALSCNDDKCYIRNNNVKCLTFGHYKM